MTSAKIEGREGSAVRAGMDVHFAVQSFLNEEARMLDAHEMRVWLDTMVHPDIRYQMTIRPELLARDAGAECVWVYDDDFAALEMRVLQFETGLQKMHDPLPRIMRMITNVIVTPQTDKNVFEVRSYGMLVRFRREYEEDTVFYKRCDLVERISEVSFRIRGRSIEIPKRVFTGKNLLIVL